MRGWEQHAKVSSSSDIPHPSVTLLASLPAEREALQSSVPRRQGPPGALRCKAAVTLHVPGHELHRRGARWTLTVGSLPQWGGWTAQWCPTP